MKVLTNAAVINFIEQYCSRNFRQNRAGDSIKREEPYARVILIANGGKDRYADEVMSDLGANINPYRTDMVNGFISRHRGSTALFILITVKGMAVYHWEVT